MQSKITVGFYKTSADVEKRGATLLVSKKQELIVPLLRYQRFFVWGGGGEIPIHDKIASKSGIVPIAEMISGIAQDQKNIIHQKYILLIM